MAILYVGIDLAKNAIAVHGANEAGKPELVRPGAPRARPQSWWQTCAAHPRHGSLLGRPAHVAELAKYDQEPADPGPDDDGRSMRGGYASPSNSHTSTASPAATGP